MTGAELLETYPKAAAAIKEFYYGKMIDSLEEDNDIPQEFKDMVQAQQFDSEYVATFINTNPRFLFDIFDENGVYIEILVDLTKDDALFSYVIDGDIMGNVEGVLYNSRIEAEKVAIEKAFQLLNDKL
jgi:hypothetical protein